MYADSTKAVLKIVKKLKNRHKRYEKMFRDMFEENVPLEYAIAKLEEHKMETRQVLLIVRQAIDETLEREYDISENVPEDTDDALDSIDNMLEEE